MKFKQFITSHREKKRAVSVAQLNREGGGKLSRDGRVYLNENTEIDTTSQTPTRRSLIKRP